jgi:hypothetical protein
MMLNPHERIAAIDARIEHLEAAAGQDVHTYELHALRAMRFAVAETDAVAKNLALKEAHVWALLHHKGDSLAAPGPFDPAPAAPVDLAAVAASLSGTSAMTGPQAAVTAPPAAS